MSENDVGTSNGPEEIYRRNDRNQSAACRDGAQTNGTAKQLSFLAPVPFPVR